MAKLLHTIWALLLNIFGLQIFRTCFANAMEDEDCESLLSGPPFSSVFFSIGIYIIIVNSTLFPRSFHAPKMVFLILYEVSVITNFYHSFSRTIPFVRILFACLTFVSLAHFQFLATAFILEFALACIWTPIDVLLSTTLPSSICYVILRFNIPYDIRKRITPQKCHKHNGLNRLKIIETNVHFIKIRLIFTRMYLIFKKQTLRRFGLEDAAVSFLTNKSWTIVLTYTASITFLILTLHVVDAVDYIVLRYNFHL